MPCFGNTMFASKFAAVSTQLGVALRRPIPKWFTDAKFGIFIHWGCTVCHGLPNQTPMALEAITPNGTGSV